MLACILFCFKYWHKAPSKRRRVCGRFSTFVRIRHSQKLITLHENDMIDENEHGKISREPGRVIDIDYSWFNLVLACPSTRSNTTDFGVVLSRCATLHAKLRHCSKHTENNSTYPSKNPYENRETQQLLINLLIILHLLAPWNHASLPCQYHRTSESKRT